MVPENLTTNELFDLRYTDPTDYNKINQILDQYTDISLVEQKGAGKQNPNDGFVHHSLLTPPPTPTDDSKDKATGCSFMFDINNIIKPIDTGACLSIYAIAYIIIQNSLLNE